MTERIAEAYCNEQLSNRLFADGYHGDNVNGIYVPGDEYDMNGYFISLACALRWLREVKGVYINIRMTFHESEYTADAVRHFVADIFDIESDQWHDNDIWEDSYEKCGEAAISYYYDHIKNHENK